MSADGDTRKVSLLDHGYLQVIEHWGSDQRIVEAARMSTDKGFFGWGVEETCAKCKGSGTNEPEHGPGSLCKVCRGRRVFVNTPGDEKLLRYLAEHHHDSPFEMAGMVIEVQAPIFVFREWHRHRTQSYNEMSARYTPLPDVNYLPTVERLMMNGGANKQAQGTGAVLTVAAAHEHRGAMIDQYRQQQDLYVKALAAGVPKELARVHLGVGRYSRMRASANLRNWLGFMTLRVAPEAQWEIRQYAWAMHAELSRVFPRTMSLFNEKNNVPSH